MSGPWYISVRAVRDIAQQTIASGRAPAPMENGALRYRGPAPLRLTLIVTPRAEGTKPQLVRVLASHQRRTS